jgi:hypothetical protein
MMTVSTGESESNGETRSPMRGVIVVIVLPLTAVAVFLLIGYQFKSALQEQLNPAKYESVLTKLKKSGELGPAGKALDYFPAKIPPMERNPRFYYRPHYGEAGYELQLRYALPHEEITKLIAEISPIAKQTALGSATNSNINFRDFQNRGFGVLPADFRLYFLDVKESPPELAYSYGVAISEERNEVVYWLQD